MKKRALKIAFCSVFICLLITAYVYAVTPASKQRADGKIHFLASPNPIAFFGPPEGKDADRMFVWVAVFKDSTFGSFKMACVGYETNLAGGPPYFHNEYHWYTDNLRAGNAYAYLTTKIYPNEVFDYDVTLAKIDINASEHELNVTIIVKGKTVFSAEFKADTSSDLQSRLDISGVSEEEFRGVEAYRPLETALVTRLDHGGFLEGRFDYIDAEIYDSSLLK